MERQAGLDSSAGSPRRQACSYPRAGAAIRYGYPALSRAEYTYKYSDKKQIQQQFPLFDQARGTIPRQRVVEFVQQGPAGLGNIDGQAAAALQKQVEEGGRLGVVGYGGVERGVQPREFRIGRAELYAEVPQVVIETIRGRAVEIGLHRLVERGVGQALPVRAHDGAEGVGECIQSGAVHQRDGAGVLVAFLVIIEIVILLAIGPQVRFFPGQHVPGQCRVNHAAGQDLRRGEDHVVADILECISHFDAAGQAGVEDQVVEVHRDRLREILHIDPGDPVGGAPVLIADGLGLRPFPGRLPGLLGTSQPHRRLHVLSVARRDPARAVGGDDHPVVPGREGGADVVQHAADGFTGGAERHIFIDLERVPDGLSVRAAVHTHEHGGMGCGIVAGRRHAVHEGDDGLVIRQTGQDIRAERVQIGLEVAAEVVVTHSIIDEDLLKVPRMGRVEAIAGRQQDGCQAHENMSDPAHRLQI